MGKKRSKDRSSREEDDIDLSGPSCRHIKKGTDQAIVKKLSGNTACHWTNCQGCNPEDKEDSSAPSQDTETEDSEPVWMCLKCGHRGCGRHSENKHAIKHYETPRSEPHCLVVSLDNWAVWCYICDDEVQYSQTGHLAQVLTNLKKLTSADPTKEPQKTKEDVSQIEQKLDALKLEEFTNQESKDNQEQPKKKENKKRGKESPVRSIQSNSEESRGVPVKGLSNLGNTCFFNSVIQNLSQTHVLRDSLNKVAEEKITLKIEPAASSNLEPVSVNLARPGPLTLTMCQLLNEIQETKKNVVAPRELFTQVCKKAARFKGFQQQDSQELLRYLLDGMRAEEIKRTTSGLMDSLKESRKESDEEKLKTLAKEYEKKTLPKNVVDQVFGGEMTSTVMCQQCKTFSVVKEMFLDLSLPVSDEAYRKKFQKKASQKSSNTSEDGDVSPVLTNGNDDIPSGNKFQQKKAKKQAKKQAKQQRRQQKFDSRPSLDSLTSPQSCGHVDPNDANKSPDPHEEVANGHEHSDTNSEPHDPISENEDTEKTTSSNRFTLLSDQPSNESTLEQPSDIFVIQDSEEDTEMADRGGQNNDEKANLDEAFLGDPELASEESLPCPEEKEEPAEAQEYTVVNQDPDSAFQTLAQRPCPEKQECSVRSCLHQFTEVEKLTQNNSLLCVTCTKRQRAGKAGDSKKNVYTDALKQMLISSPPPVLTLHLKRFQQNGFSLCKVNRHVQFPMVLDLAPFCAADCKTSVESDGQVLYSLYGIVEHSGTMRSGHYTAYVKVRPRCVQSQSNGFSAQGATEAPKGSWFHISDTSVQPVPESKVQSCQAYLLFYERTL